MFTGIIEEIGVVSSVIRKNQFLRLSVYAKTCLSDLQKGDSISINGVCLTVVDMGRNNFSVEVSDETQKFSNLGLVKIGDKVNLERALLVGARMGGHIMSGHVDGMAEIKGKIKHGDGIELIASLPRQAIKYLVEKGSLALDGVSLTITKITSQGVSVLLIPQTIKSTHLASKNIGEKINYEVDLLSKYVEHHLMGEPPTEAEKIMLGSGFIPMGIMEN